jgi:hypothetical protein
MRGLTQTQALCRAVKEALATTQPYHNHNIILWVCHKPLLTRLTTLLPHSDTPTVLEVCRLLYEYLTTHPSTSIEIRSCERAWLGSRCRAEIKRIAITEEPPELPEAEMDPKAAMWARIQRDYTPSTHPSHVACAPPDGNTPPPAIWAAIAHRNRLICSTIFCFAVTHCFDADYSDCFRSGANDTTECPCNLTHPPHPHDIPRRHTRHHIIFHCPLAAPACLHHLSGASSLPTILHLETATAALCRFLEESNSSLLRPLPVLRLGRDPP